jgi:hypothetical protein
MTPTVTMPKRTLQDALYTLSIEKAVPDAAVLDDIIRAYPQFAEELTDFAIDIAIDSLRNQAQENDAPALRAHLGEVSPAVSRAMSRFQNRLHTLQAAPHFSPSNENALATGFGSEAGNPFIHLSREEFRDLAQRLGVNTVFVSKLRDRQIQPNTIPVKFQNALANEMRAPLGLVIAHLGATQAAPQGQFFKAEGKPQTSAQQTFEEAVRGSGLSQNQQDGLLRL